MSALRFDNATIRLGRRDILSAASFVVQDREFIGMLGPNGSGKTTLMRAALGLVPVASGAVSILDRPVTRGNSAIGAGLKLPVTYHVVVAFDRDEEGDLRPGEAQEVMSPFVAERRARALALEHAGALAFSRTGNPATGEFQDAVILARFGDVDLHSLSE